MNIHVPQNEWAFVSQSANTPPHLLLRQPCTITPPQSGGGGQNNNKTTNKQTKKNKPKLYFSKAAFLFGGLFVSVEAKNGSALPIIPLSFLLTATRHIVHPRRRVRHWRASVLICNEKAQQRRKKKREREREKKNKKTKNISAPTKKKKKEKVIYLGTSERCHIYPSKRQRSKQVIWDMSKTWTGGERGRGGEGGGGLEDCRFILREI